MGASGWLAVQPLDGLAPDLRFERLPLAVFGAQLRGQHTRAAQICLFQQTHREARLAEPAGSVDARGEREAHGRGGERFIAHARLLRQREKAGRQSPGGDLLRPQRVMKRFSPSSGITSATVPTATRSP